MEFLKKENVLIAVAVVCVALYFYGSQIKKDSQYLQALPIIGGLAFGFNTLIALTK